MTIAHRRVVAALALSRSDEPPLRHPREKLLTLLKEAEPGTVFERASGQLELFPEVEADELCQLDRMASRVGLEDDALRSPPSSG
ncbi:hypothetical protein [Jannaschia sp. LMIT008]|uniref:hypothetical protein n=1 Tax=Jannaschia maritima TaxID=3032585 RepID=UPI00281243D4|nr:hypothetical protein [Jannaschia sp. LMIT008]